MTLCLSHQSAVEYLREAGAHSSNLTPLKKRILPDLTPHAREIAELKTNTYSFLHQPIHVLVANAANRRVVQDILCHVAPTQTAPRFLLETSHGLLVEGPGLSLLHAATELPLPLLIERAFEFCGGYRLYPSDPRGFVDCDPLTNRAQLAHFTEAIGKAKGSQQLKHALAYTCDGSRSPMETVVVLLLCLPPRLGGYGLPMPLMNYRVNVTKSGRKMSSNHYYVCDAFWPDVWLDVEYDSDLAHTGSARIARDAKRRNGLISLGVTVITITRAQVFNCQEMDRIAHIIAKRLGRRFRMGGNAWVQARAKLRRQLLRFDSTHLMG